MRTLSLKMDELVFEETEKILLTGKKPRNRYINDAVKYYNNIQKKILLEKVLRNESQTVMASSLEVLKEFENIDYELQTI
jgi:mannose-1-phosphate guanylyltransferase